MAYVCAYGVITHITSGKYGICVCLQGYYTYYMNGYLCVPKGLLHILHRGNMAYACAYAVITHITWRDMAYVCA